MGFFSNLVDGITGKAAEDAAEAAAAGITQGIGELRPAQEAFQGQSDTGQEALAKLAAFLGVGPGGLQGQQEAFNQFQNDPGFQAQQDAGLRALTQGASAAGLRNSGGLAKDLFTFGQQQQGRAFNDRIAQIGTLANFGQNATSGLAGVLNSIANLQSGRGQVAAQGIIGGANAATGFANQLINFGSDLAGKFISPGGAGGG